MAKTRAITHSDRVQIGVAIRYAKDARDALTRAGATRAARYMARALKSAEGAQRHAIAAGYRTGDYRRFATLAEAKTHANKIAKRTGAIIAIERA